MTMTSAGNYIGIGDRREFFSVPVVRGLPISVDAGGGDDAIYYPYPAARPIVIGWAPGAVLMGGLGNDLIQSGVGPDTIYGDNASGTEGGNDFIAAGYGADVIYGGAGNDTIVADDGFFGAAFYADIFGAYFPSPDYVEGGAGDDVIWGMGGADTLLGGDGHDMLFGAGPESYETPRVTVSLTLDFNGVTDAAATSVFSLAEQYDPVRRSYDDVISGGTGNDTIVGQLGLDRLFGEAGDDHIRGGGAADLIDGGSGFDFALYGPDHAPPLDPGQGVVIRLDYQWGLGGEAQGDVLRDIEGVVGTHATDFLIGDGLGNVLLGRGGDDWLFGQAGTDWLLGGDGSDQFLGGTGGDWFYGGGQNDQFWFSLSDFEVGVFDRILDWGQAGDFDYLKLEGIFSVPLIFLDGDGYAQITTEQVGTQGGVIIFGTTVEALQPHLVFG